MSKQKYPQNNTAAVTASGTPRKGRANYSQVKTHAKQDRKRAEAYQRQDAYERLSLNKQLESCVPGGSKRQRSRIQKQMDLMTAPAVKIAPMTEEQKAVKAVKRAKDAVESVVKAKK